jgi:hypothetical protein
VNNPGGARGQRSPVGAEKGQRGGCNALTGNFRTWKDEVLDRSELFLSREGTTLGLTFWESRELAERHRAARMQFLDRMTTAADVQVEETVDYTVTFADLGSLITDFNK